MTTRVHEVEFPGDGFWTAVTAYVQAESMELDELLLTGDYRSCKDVYRFRIAGYTDAIHDDLMNADEAILFRCSEGATTIFTGKIDPNFQQQIGTTMGPLQLEAEDNSYLLDEPLSASVAYPALVGGAAYKIFDSGDTDNSLIHCLLDAAGYDIDTEIAAGTPDILDTVEHVSASEGEATYWELIDDILHYHGYAMRWTAGGQYTHVNWAPSAVVSAHTFALATNPPLRTSRKFMDFDGVEVEWYVLDTLSDARLYQMDVPFNADGTFAGISIAAGSEHPLGADEDDTYQHYEERWLERDPRDTSGFASTVALGRPRPKPSLIRDIDLIATSGHSIKDSYDNGITRTVSYESLRAKLYYSNPTGGTLKLYYSYIYGDALFRQGIKKTKSLFAAGATRLMPIQTRHLYTEAAAQKYAVARRNTLQYGDFTYTLSDRESVNVGSIATIAYTDPVTSISISTTVMVVGKRKAPHLPLYHYIAYGVAAYSVEPVDTEGEEVTNLAFEGIRDAARSSSLLGDASAYSEYDAIPQADCEYWDLRQPDCKSHLGRAPESGYLVSFFPGHLYDEIRTEYDNLWAKFTGLGTVGVFQGTTNRVSDPEDLTTSNWTLQGGCAAELSDYYWDGKRFTKVTTGATANRGVYQALSFTGDGMKAISVIAKQADAVTDSTVYLYDTTASAARLEMDIDWTTHTVTAVTGTLVRATWYGTDQVVEILALATAVTAANTNNLYLRPSIASTNKDAYFTAVQAEDLAYPTPYTPTERADGALCHPFTIGDEGTIECWVRPWFTYDVAAGGFVWCIGDTLANSLSLRYDNTNDTFIARLYIDGSNYRTVENDAAYTTNAGVWQWIHLKVTWDISAQEIGLWVNKVEQTESGSAGNVTAFAPASDELFIGNRAGASHFDGLITDLLYKPYVDESTDHYDGGVPYYDPDEIANQYQSVRISKRGIRMHNSDLVITDALNRRIEISNAAGMLARDAGGQVIHDIADAPVQIGNYYMGHLYYSRDNANHVVLNTATPAVTTWTDVTCLDDENSNVRGGLFNVWIIAGKLTTNYTSLRVRLYLRPNGSSWGTGSGGSTPVIGSTQYTYSGSVGSTMSLMGLIICPIASDGKIEYYWDPDPTGEADHVEIRQIGVFI